MRQPGIFVVFLAVLLCMGCVSTPLPEVHYPTSPTLRAVTYNIHYADLSLGLHEVAVHAAEVAEVLNKIDADLVFLQEVSTALFPAYVHPCPLREHLEAHLASYGWIGSEGASQTGGSTPILYRFDRYYPIRQGVEWFSDDPAIPDSTGWGNDLPRHMTWALFWDAWSKRHVFVANVHLDHISRRANARAIHELVTLIHRYARIDPEDEFSRAPVLLGGDLNEPAGWPSRGPLDEVLTSVLSAGDGPTRRGVLGLQIDAIYVSDAFSIINATILTTATPSDHFPLVANLRMSGRLQ